MAIKSDLSGQRFGRWLVVKLSHISKHRVSVYKCTCDCGISKEVLRTSLINGRSKSCGCWNLESLKQRQNRLTHGHSVGGKTSRTYNSWMTMSNRCRCANYPGYKDYGGRGIKVCKRWGKFENFLEDMGERPSGKSLDRINNNKGYSKNNCQWATDKEQARNSRHNNNITYKGKTQCLKAWEEELKLPSGILSNRINRSKWSVEKSLTRPVIKRAYQN